MYLERRIVLMEEKFELTRSAFRLLKVEVALILKG
jgi:hypothetical protein